MTRRGIGFGVLALALAVGCEARRAQLVVVVDSDLEPSEIGAVRLIASDETGAMVDRYVVAIEHDPEAMSEGRVALPFSFGLAPPGDDATRSVRLSVQALGNPNANEMPADGDLLSVERLADVSFIEGQSLRLPIFLARTCLGVECGEGLTCVDGSCQETGVDPGDLDPSTPGSNVAPELHSPYAGAYTGSVHAERSLRPRFAWRPVEGAVDYELEVTPCDAPLVVDCPDVAPALLERISPDGATHPSGFVFHVPASPLPVRTEAPVGQRYRWRVRACTTTETCGAWSRSRHLEVGRLPNDFNGDGYSDLAIGAREMWDVGTSGSRNFRGRVYVYSGGTAGVAATTMPAALRVESVNGDAGGAVYFGSAVATGDLNGDGFADLTGGAIFDETVLVLLPEVRSGMVHVFVGGADGLTHTQGIESPILERDLDTEMDRRAVFGQYLGIRDLDGDGKDDLIVGAPGLDVDGMEDSGRAWVFHGSTIAFAAQLEVLPTTRVAEGWFGKVGVAGDLDGDGLADFRVVREFHFDVLPPPGAVVGLAATLTISPPATATGFSLLSTNGDIDGDGLADLLASDAADATDGVVLSYLSRGGRADRATPLETRVAPGDGARVGLRGTMLGDVDGDGFDDAGVCGNDDRCWLLFGGPEGFDSTATIQLDAPFVTPAHDLFGTAIAGVGDLDGDGRADFAIRHSGARPGSGCPPDPVVHVYRGGAARLIMGPVTLQTPDPTCWLDASSSFGTLPSL